MKNKFFIYGIYVSNIIIYIFAYFIVTFSKAITQPTKSFYYNGELIEIFAKENFLYLHIFYFIGIVNLILLLKTKIHPFLIFGFFIIILSIFTLLFS